MAAQARTRHLDEWASDELLKAHKPFLESLKRADVMEPLPLHCAVQNAEDETPLELVQLLYDPQWWAAQASSKGLGVGKTNHDWER